MSPGVQNYKNVQVTVLRKQKSTNLFTVLDRMSVKIGFVVVICDSATFARHILLFFTCGRIGGAGVVSGSG